MNVCPYQPCGLAFMVLKFVCFLLPGVFQVVMQCAQVDSSLLGKKAVQKVEFIKQTDAQVLLLFLFLLHTEKSYVASQTSNLAFNVLLSSKSTLNRGVQEEAQKKIMPTFFFHLLISVWAFIPEMLDSCAFVNLIQHQEII